VFNIFFVVYKQGIRGQRILLFWLLLGVFEWSNEQQTFFRYEEGPICLFVYIIFFADVVIFFCRIPDFSSLHFRFVLIKQIRNVSFQLMIDASYT